MKPLARRYLVARARLMAVELGERFYNGFLLGRLTRTRHGEVINRLRMRWHDAVDVHVGLEDLVRLIDLLEQTRAAFWLAGGWGIDALIGHQTRPHRDVDIVVREQDRSVVIAALHREGFRSIPGTARGASRQVPAAFLPARELLRDPTGRTVDVHFVDLRNWPPAGTVSHPFARGTLGGRSVGCLSAAAQRAAHSMFELEPEHLLNVRALDHLDE